MCIDKKCIIVKISIFHKLLYRFTASSIKILKTKQSLEEQIQKIILSDINLRESYIN